MALSDRDCRHGRQIGKCADCALDPAIFAASLGVQAGVKSA